MCNHQNDVKTKTLFRNEYSLKEGVNLVVRTPEISDAESLINQMKIVDGETRYLAREPDEFDLTIEQEVEFIKRCTDNEDMLFLVGEVNGEIVANCSVGIVQNKKRFLHRAAMGIAVKKDYWGKGVGRKLMHECINWCKQCGIEQLELEVVTQNERAISLYEKLGFEVCGTKTHAMKYSDGTYADEYFMVLFLNEKH